MMYENIIQRKYYSKTLFHLFWLSIWIIGIIQSIHAADGSRGLQVKPLEAEGKRYAVVIGINSYDDPRIGELNFAVSDAKAVSERLKSEELDFRDVALLTSDSDNRLFLPTRSNVRRVIRQYFQQSRADEMVFLYFAGHGSGKHLLLQDSDSVDLEETALHIEDDLMVEIEKAPAKKKFVIIDSCESGALQSRSTPVDLEEMFKDAKGTVVMASAHGDQKAYEWEDKQHGVFTYFFLDALSGLADRDKDGYLLVSEVADYTWRKTRDWSRKRGFSQLPVIDVKASGPLLMAKTKKLFVIPPDPTPTPFPQIDTLGLGNGVSLEMRYIPGGSFMMGNTEEEIEYLLNKYEDQGIKPEYVNDEKPRHRVTISPFYLATYETTNAQFEQFVHETGYVTTAEKIGTGRTYDSEKSQWTWVKGATWKDLKLPSDWKRKGDWGNHPVAMVSWDDAKAFCDWLSKKTGQEYRLPTEAEWEYACRAGTDTRRWWGDDENDSLACKYANIADKGNNWTPCFNCDDGHKISAPVGSYRANRFGLYDILGNVWEWCEDWYGKDYYSKSPMKDPVDNQSNEYRVLRGGGWSGNPGVVRSANRNRYTPDDRNNNLGFRPARTLYP